MTLSNIHFLKQLAQYFKDKGVDSYLVGGCVRDLIMQVAVKDLDIMLEGDATKILSELYKNQDFYYKCSKPIIFKKYKTAKVKFENQELDFSSARTEIYPEIASNPVCSPGNLTQDLARRDFSINSIALPLSDLNSPIDLFDGISDIKNKKIKILHDQSFRDDPVRLLRAVRFICRFNFSLEDKTSELFSQAILNKYSTFLPKPRVYQELKKALNEECWQEIFTYLLNINLLEQLSELLHKACLELDLKELNAKSIEDKVSALAVSLSFEEKEELLKNFGIKK